MDCCRLDCHNENCVEIYDAYYRHETRILNSAVNALNILIVNLIKIND